MTTYKEFITFGKVHKLARYQFSVLDICKTLMMESNGSSDSLTTEEEELYKQWLKWRIDEWEIGLKKFELYDQSVKMLILSVLHTLK